MAKLAAAETRLKRQAVQATMREAIIDVSSCLLLLGSEDCGGPPALLHTLSCLAAMPSHLSLA